MDLSSARAGGSSQPRGGLGDGASEVHSGSITPQSEQLPPEHSKAEQVAPPYWPGHRRSYSTASYASLQNSRPVPITLLDNTAEQAEPSPLWAKHVTIDDYLVIQGNGLGIGAYVVWICKVQTLDGGPMIINKRYSEFDDLRQKLLQTFPLSEGAMPPLPPKSVISKFRPKFLEKRRAGLSYFLHCVLLNPEFAGSPVLKAFLFS